MAQYQLYCFAQSGNAYRAALMLNLIGADWEPIWVDFFGKGEPRSPQYRANVNEMGEVPVLAHEGKKLSQSGVILTYLAKHTGKFHPEGEDKELEALRWIIFDNQKVNGFLGPASTSPPSTRTSRCGLTASRHCRAGSILTTLCQDIHCRTADRGGSSAPRSLLRWSYSQPRWFS